MMIGGKSRKTEASEACGEEAQIRKVSRLMDHLEAWANAIAGLAISTLIVMALRWADLWDAPALALSGVFFAASVARSYALRRAFRRMG